MEPGKIPHEIRHGELAQLGILPYQPYYGTHDATSLYVIVLSYLYQWLGDEAVLRRYLPNAEAALRWIDRYGDRDRDGLPGVRDPLVARLLQPGLEGRRRRDPGGRRDAGARCRSRCASSRATSTTRSFGWPTSTTSSAGRRTPGGCGARRASCSTGSTRRFWWEEEGTYALGLDGKKEPIRSVASNAGHLLQSGIVPPERADRVVKRLLADDMWSGWGIRTLSSDHPGVQPVQLSHRQRLAARQRDDRRRLPALRLRRRGGPGRQGHVRRRGAARRLPPAGAVRRPAARRGELPGPVSRAPTSRRPGPPDRSSGSSRSWPASTPCQTATARGSTSTRRCPIGCRRSRSGTCGRAAARSIWHSSDGTVDVLSNTTGFEVIHGPAPRPDPGARAGR